MITTLAGTNTFMLRHELRQFVDAFVGQYSDIGLERYDGEELEPNKLNEALQSLPFLASKKMVVIKNAGRNKTLTTPLETLLGQVPDTTDLVLLEDHPDKRTTYYKTLQKKTDFKVYDDLDERTLAKWLVEQATRLSGTLTSADASYLISRVGPNQVLLANELQKLVHYKSAITKDTINEMTEPLPQSSVFDLLDVAFAGNAKKALQLYGEQRQQRVEPLAILGMIAWQLHVLAVVKTAGNRKSGEIASLAHLSPYVVSKSEGIVRRINLTQLKSLVTNAYHLDIRLKSQAIDADEALRTLLLSLS